MRAGQLTHRVQVLRMFDRQTPSGAVTQEKVCIELLRCAIVRQSGFYSEAGSELHDTQNIVFQTWYNPKVVDTDTVLWSNQEFRIVLIEQDEHDNTMKLYCQKILK